jgi:protein-L-isoaspartate(D-aspartate) O-methyltransferase
MITLEARRRFFAEEIAAVAGVSNATLINAFAAVPRERFLPAGPWVVRSDMDFGAPLRQTPDADPAHTYHNYSVAIRPERQLFNGAPALLATAIDALDVAAGARVLHIGTGLGYYAAILARLTGPAGRVVAIEIDADLAESARANLASIPWVDVRQGDAATIPDERFDAILVNAGTTHVPRAWTDVLNADGRMILPLTASMPGTGAVGKGLLLRLSATPDPHLLEVRPITFVAIYSAVGVRDDKANAQLGQALAKHPFPPLKRLRLDPHEPAESCWLHTDRGCFGR